MGKWAKVLISGSNFHVNALTASFVSDIGSVNPSSISEDRRKVVVYGINTSGNPLAQQFFRTGSYGNAGLTAGGIDWFPFQGDIGLTVASGQSTTRTITVGKNRTNFGGALCGLRVTPGASSPQLTFRTGFLLDSKRASRIDHSGSGDLRVALDTPLVATTAGIARATSQTSLQGLSPQWSNGDDLIYNNSGEASVDKNNRSIRLKYWIKFFQATADGNRGLDDVKLSNTLLGIQSNVNFRTGNGDDIEYEVYYRSMPYISNGTTLYIESDRITATINNTSFDDGVNQIGGTANVLNFPRTGGGLRFLNSSIPGAPPLISNTNKVIDMSPTPTGGFFIELVISALSGATATNKLFVKGGSGITTSGPALILYLYESENDKGFSINSATEDELIAIPKDGSFRMPFPPQTTTSSPILLVQGRAGDATLPTGPNIGYKFDFSTKKVKTDINPIGEDIIEGFDKLKPVAFRFISNPEVLQGGFIAEESADAHPIFASFKPNYPVYGGLIHLNQPLIDDSLVPLDISERGIMAGAVKKLQLLEKEINQLNG